VRATFRDVCSSRSDGLMVAVGFQPTERSGHSRSARHGVTLQALKSGSSVASRPEGLKDLGPGLRPQGRCPRDWLRRAWMRPAGAPHNSLAREQHAYALAPVPGAGTLWTADPGHRPAASAQGWVLAARWAASLAAHGRVVAKANVGLQKTWERRALAHWGFVASPSGTDSSRV
jgi:hypothetical protein